MTVELEMGGRTRMVRLAHQGGHYRVEVDTRSRDVDAVRLPTGAWSLVIGSPGQERIGGRSYEVGLVERPGGALTVYVNGRAVVVTPGRGRRRRADAAGADAGSGPQTVSAPMPGRVVKVLVTAGEAVAARQGLVVVEAMKMENELRASRAGVVREVRVAEGVSVEANTVLVVLD